MELQTLIFIMDMDPVIGMSVFVLIVRLSAILHSQPSLYPLHRIERPVLSTAFVVLFSLSTTASFAAERPSFALPSSSS